MVHRLGQGSLPMLQHIHSRTRVVIQPDTVEFLPHNSKMPLRYSAENATIAATELIHALRNPAPAEPYAHIGDVQMQALDQLAERFQRATVQPQQQVPTESSKHPPGLPPRVAPNLPRVNIPPITAIPDQDSFTTHTPNESEKRVHIIPPDTPHTSKGGKKKPPTRGTNSAPSQAKDTTHQCTKYPPILITPPMPAAASSE